MLYTGIGLLLAIPLVIKILVFKKKNYYFDWIAFIITGTFVFSGSQLRIEAFLMAIFLSSTDKFGDFGRYVNKMIDEKEEKKRRKR